MTVVMMLMLLLPSLDKAYSLINAQPLLLDLANQQPDKPVSVIVQKTVKDSSVEQAVQGLGGTVTKDLHIINAFTAELPSKQIPALAATGGVKWVSLDTPVVKTGCTGCVDSTKLLNTYDGDIKADKLWNKTLLGVTSPWLQGQGIGVAVVDSGVTKMDDFKTPDGKSSRVLKQVEFSSSTTKLDDTYGHGTFVAGVIAGDGTKSGGNYVGIAPQANIISVKISDDNGASNASDVVAGLQWILDNKNTYNIRVVNISFNSSVAQSYNVDPLDAAAEVLWFKGIVVVTAAGNSGSANLYAPANDPFVITVGAVDDLGTASTADDVVAPFSAYGSDETGTIKPDLVAPGKNIISTIPGTVAKMAFDHSANLVGGNYLRSSGTSFAAPQVAGAVALLIQSEPYLTPDQVKYRLKATAVQNNPRYLGDTRSWAGYNPVSAGAGYLDINEAMSQKLLIGTVNTGLAASQLLWTGSTPVTWSSVNWSSVNWSSVNWSSVNWSSVNWSSVNWSSTYWGN